MNNEDLCQLEQLDSQTLLDVLRKRYLNAEIYTNCGLLLLSINPYCQLDIYSKEIKKIYKQNKMDRAHVYQLIEECIKNMESTNKDHSIIISGESGSGKTECTKIIMDYYCVNDEFSAIIKKVDFIIESLGNAKTVHNNNSSRFGKLIKINKNIEFETFLLEKSRVTQQGPGEQNFHIFYYILDGNGLSVKNDYINYTSEKVLDTSYEELKMAFHALELDFDQVEKYLLGILELGNLNLTNIDASRGADEFCEIFNMKKEEFVAYLKYKVRKIGPDVIKSNNSQEEFKVLRDSLARIIYARIFEYVVEQINLKLSTFKKSESVATLNILDIFGFEDFKTNGLDQFCINWCNEKIYDEFIKTTFENQKNIFIEEEINVDKTNLNIKNLRMNKSNIEMIEKKCGLADLIAEESFLNGKCENLCIKIENILKLVIKYGDTFEFKHFVGSIDYNTRQFVEKNKEKGNLQLLSKTQYLFRDTDVNESKALDPLKNVVGAFRQSLNKLFDILNSTQIKYIKCIKPNQTKDVLNFDVKTINSQLKVNGILQTIQLSKHLYPCYMFKDEFLEKYSWIFPYLASVDESVKELILEQNENHDIELIEQIINSKVDEFVKKIVIGKTKYFYNNEMFRMLEKVKYSLEVGEKVKKEQNKARICMFIRDIYRMKIEEINEIKRAEEQRRKAKLAEFEEKERNRKTKQKKEAEQLKERELAEQLKQKEEEEENLAHKQEESEEREKIEFIDHFNVKCLSEEFLKEKQTSETCKNCAVLEKTLKQKNRELFKIQALEMEVDRLKTKLKNQKIKAVSITESESTTSIEVISPSNALGCLVQLYIDHCPFVCNKDIPKEEIVSLVHFVNYAINILAEADGEYEEKANEMIKFVTEEINKKLQYVEDDHMRVMFFLSNMIELCIILDENIIYNISPENTENLHGLIGMLYKRALAYFKNKIKDYLPFAVIEHQGIKEVKVKQSIFKKIFTGPTINDLCQTFEDSFDMMCFYCLPENFIQNALGFLLSYMDYDAFNCLLLKKTNYLSINRCTQINYNISEIMKVANRIGYVDGNKSFYHMKESIKIATVMLIGGNDKKLVEDTLDQTILNSLQINAIINLLDLQGKEILRWNKEGVHELAAMKFIKEPIEAVIGLDYITEVDQFVFPQYMPKCAIKSILDVLQSKNLNVESNKRK